MCLVLVGLVFVLAVSLWNLREKFKEEKNIAKQYLHNKHYLTGLSSRPALLEVLGNLLAESSQHQTNVALMFIDIDDFNSINGSLGVKMGDMLLQSIGQRIVSEVGAFSKHVYHIGSDEFAVILYDYGNDAATLSAIASDLLYSISQPINIHGYDLQISCCIGLCTFPECSSDAHELLKHAGSARDNAKKSGYGSYSFYTQEMSRKSVIRSLISADLRYALERNELELHYQPKIILATGAVQGAEALLRWHHPTLGNITPDVFIPVMEDLGLIHAVGKWIIHTACHEMKSLHKEGFDSLHIAINVSPHQFDKGDIASIIAESIWETGIAPQKVEIELTEAVVMSDTEKSSLMLKVLQSMGVRIAIDDFGTGYSSMNQLTSFPVDILKVDRCFVHDLHLIPANHAIVSTIIRMANQLKLEVVAEGVECEQELEILRNEHCDLIQGFYYSKPLSFKEFAKYVQKVGATTVVKGASTENSA